MNDTELYEFFKSRGDRFNEMPSAELWEKIIVNLNAAPKKTVSKSLLAKIFLLIATIIAGSLMLTNEKPIQQKKIIHAVDSTRIKKDSVKIDIKDTSKQKPLSTLHFKRLSTTKVPEKKTMFMAFKSKTKNDSVTGIKQAKISSDSTNVMQHIIQKPIEIEDSQLLNASNRIVVTSTKKLTKAEFQQFTERAIKASATANGKLLIVKAIGHKPFRHLIGSVKSDTISASILKFSNQSSIQKKDSVK